MYDEDERCEELESAKDMEMAAQGYNFVTNFTIDRKEKYENTAKQLGIRFEITDEAYDIYGERINGLLALYIDSDTDAYDLHEFHQLTKSY